MRKLALMVAMLMTITCWAASAHATTITVYTDKTEWLNALSGQYLTEDFSDTELNPGVSFVSTESGHINPAQECYQDVLASQSQNEPNTIWSFTPNIGAYGGNWVLGGPGGSGNSLLVYIEDLSLYVGSIPNSYNGGFWGFISDTPFASVKLVGGGGTNQQNYCLDDMVYMPLLDPSGTDLLEPNQETIALSLRVQNPYAVNQPIRVIGEGAQDASVGIYDTQGRLLRSLAATGRDAGEAIFSWDGRTAGGQAVAASTVFLRAEGGGRAVTCRIVLMR